MRKTYYPSSFALIQDPSVDYQYGNPFKRYFLKRWEQKKKPSRPPWWARKLGNVLSDRELDMFKRHVPVWAAVPTKYARYLRSQHRRMARGQRCNLTEGYVK